jgi:hypothetical protein
MATAATSFIRMAMLLITFVSAVTIDRTTAFAYLSDEDLVRLRMNDNAEITVDLQLIIDHASAKNENDDAAANIDGFPETFRLNFSTFNRQRLIEFHRIDRSSPEYPITSDLSIFTLDESTNTISKHMKTVQDQVLEYKKKMKMKVCQLMAIMS